MGPVASGTTRRTDDGSPVEWKTAITRWAEAGRPVLEEIAGTWGAYVTYQEMSELVQKDAGITTGVPFRHWIGSVLATLARQEKPGEPLLTSLVVRADGSIGDGYLIPVRDRGEDDPDDLELHAARERVRCYRHFGATDPGDGTEEVFTSAVAARRARPAARRTTSPQPARAVCPKCFIQLPLSGGCGNCD